MPFYNLDSSVQQTRQAQQEQNQAKLRADPDIQRALRGVFTGKYAAFAATLPAAWSPAIRNVQVAEQIAQDKGIDTSGLVASDNWSLADTGTPFAVQIAPYVMGAVGLGGAAGTFGGGGAGGAGGSTAGGYGPLAGGYGAATTEATVPGALAGVGGGAAGAAGAAGGAGAAGATGGGGGAAGAAGAAGGGIGSWLIKNLPGIVPALANVFGNIYASNKQADASAEGLAQQQKQFDEALAVEQEQQQYNRNQYSDYLGRLAPFAQTGYQANASLADFMSRPGANPPGYTPPPFAGPSTGPPSAAAVTAPPAASPAPRAAGAGPNITGGDISKQVADYFASQGVTPDPSSVQYWTQKWSEFGSRDPEYFNRRLSQADEFTRGGNRAPAAASQPATTTQGTVRLRAPDGTEQDVPASQAPYYINLGATRIGTSA